MGVSYPTGRCVTGGCRPGCVLPRSQISRITVPWSSVFIGSGNTPGAVELRGHCSFESPPQVRRGVTVERAVVGMPSVKRIRIMIIVNGSRIPCFAHFRRRGRSDKIVSCRRDRGLTVVRVEINAGSRAQTRMRSTGDRKLWLLRRSPRFLLGLHIQSPMSGRPPCRINLSYGFGKRQTYYVVDAGATALDYFCAWYSTPSS
jgi:hypothetical protein